MWRLTKKHLNLGLLQILVNSSKKIDSNFILELLKLADNDFYILPLGKTIQLFTKDFKGTIAFNLRRPNVESR